MSAGTGRSSRLPVILSGALLLTTLACPSADAQPTGRPVYEGAGGDPRISVSQPESTSQASGGYGVRLR